MHAGAASSRAQLSRYQLRRTCFFCSEIHSAHYIKKLIVCEFQGDEATVDFSCALEKLGRRHRLESGVLEHGEGEKSSHN